MDPNFFDANFWKPSIMHHHAKELDYVGNFDTSFIYYFERGHVFTYSKMTSTNLCKCDFSNYPFDQHVCKLFVGSTTDTMEHLVFRSSFNVDTRLQNVIQYDITYKPLVEIKEGYEVVGQNVSVAGVDILMKRYLLLLYTFQSST